MLGRAWRMNTIYADAAGQQSCDAKKQDRLCAIVLKLMQLIPV
jgi:hypothetical protein